MDTAKSLVNRSYIELSAVSTLLFQFYSTKLNLDFHEGGCFGLYFVTWLFICAAFKSCNENIVFVKKNFIEFFFSHTFIIYLKYENGNSDFFFYSIEHQV